MSNLSDRTVRVTSTTLPLMSAMGKVRGQQEEEMYNRGACDTSLTFRERLFIFKKASCYRDHRPNIMLVLFKLSAL